MATRSDNAEVEQRIGEVFTLLVSGLTSRNIIQFATEKWGVTPRQVRTYIARANEYLAEAAETRRETELGKAIERLNKLFASAMRVQDYRVALSVQKEIDTLLGLYEPARHELTGKDGGAVETLIRVVYEDTLNTDGDADNADY